MNWDTACRPTNDPFWAFPAPFHSKAFALLYKFETSWALIGSPILYLAFSKTIVAALFRAFGLPLSFLPSKPSFLHDHSTTQHSDFSSFLAISTTDKPVNRSIQAYALTQLNVFALRGFIFRDIHKKQGRSSSNSGYEIQKICGWKIYSRTRTFGAEVHKSNIRVKRWHNKYENSELYWKTQLLLKCFP